MNLFVIALTSVVVFSSLSMVYGEYSYNTKQILRQIDDFLKYDTKDLKTTQLPNGTKISDYYDVKILTTQPDDTQVFLYMDTVGFYHTFTKYPNGTCVTRYVNHAGGHDAPDSELERMQIEYPNGTIKSTNSPEQGQVYTTYPAPTYSYDNKYDSRENMIEFPNGTKVIKFWNGTQIIEHSTVHQTAQIPSWIKNNAKWWSDGTLSDKEFATGVGYMIQHKIISANVATNTDGTILVNDNLSIPAWIKNNAKWWSEGKISDTDFTSGIQYIVNQKIISFSEHVNKKQGQAKDTTKTPNKNKQNETDSILNYIPNPTLRDLTTPEGSPSASDHTRTNAAIQLQSRHGSYEPVEGSTDRNLLYATWVLKSNGVDYKTAKYIIREPDGEVYVFDAQIHNGVIQIGPHPVVQTGTFVFKLERIDGLQPPDNNQVEIIIPAAGETSNPPSTTVQTGPITSVPSQSSTDLQFIIPSQITQEATSGSGAIVSFNTPIPPGSSNLIITCQPASGSQFPIRNTVVTCTATDTQSQKTLQKTFTVTVRDTTPPTIGPFQPVTGATDDSGAIVYFTISANDLVDGPVTPVCNHNSGDKFPLGVSTITCTAKDSRGNQSTRTLQITITKS